MDREAAACAQGEVRLHGLVRIDVLRAHEPAGTVGANGQQREGRRPEAIPDLLEVRPPARVPGEVDAPGGASHEEGPPEQVVPIREPPLGPVLRRREGDRHRGQRRGLPPVEILRVRDAGGLQQGTGAEPREDARFMLPREAPEGGQVEVIEMAVADQDAVDPRELLEAHPGLLVARGAQPGSRPHALRPDRIGEQVHAIELDQRRRVVHEGHPDLARRGRCLGPRRAGGDVLGPLQGSFR